MSKRQGVRAAAAVILLASAAGMAQVTGSFSLDKQVYAQGEPVFLNMTLSNHSGEPQAVSEAEPYSFCSGFVLHIRRQGDYAGSCQQGYGGSCVSGVVTLPPHGSLTQRILLNYPNHSQGDLHPPVNLPGDYTVDALDDIHFGPAPTYSTSYQSPGETEVHQLLTLRVDSSLPADPALFTPYVQQLQSSDLMVRREAARTLATLAPTSLEALLLTFATTKDWAVAPFAAQALFNLHTERSLAALAAMLTTHEPASYEYASAAEFLAKTHDPKWLPVLLAVADEGGPQYLTYAAEAGGDLAVPALRTRLGTASAANRSNVIWALGASRSRAAIPVLIGMLAPHAATAPGSEEAQQSSGAAWALEKLTGLTVERNRDGSPPADLQYRWQQWWLREGQTAPVYAQDACVEQKPLP